MPFNNQRVQLKVEGYNDAGSLAFLGKVDHIHDEVLEGNDAKVRELYADYIADSFTVRVGRQIITWGVGDLLFINDIFPKDWVAFFSGLPMEYFKRGSDATKLDLYIGSTTLEVVVSDFRADRLPDNHQFVLTSPFSPSLPRNIDEPVGREFALKDSVNIGGWDTALYISYGYFHSPVLSETGNEISGAYPRLNTFGMSLSGALAGGVFNLEADYYDSEDDRNGSNPEIENSQARFMMATCVK